jgi:L-ascorbate 6-phosphate lactonase
MKWTWLGQAGLLIEADNKKIIIDPYLSDSVQKVNADNYRRVPVDSNFLKIQPDILIVTHNHLDHTDPETLPHYLDGENSVTVLASKNAWRQVRQMGKNNNYIMFNRHTQWTEGNFRFYAVYAEHSDNSAIGVIIEYKGKKYYVAGDTLYNTKVLNDLPKDIEVAFLPVNGKGNNMNMDDALRFAHDCGAKKVVPVHFGMFDEIVPKGFLIIPKIYEEIKL